MANWAYNWVNFSGEETQIKKVNAMFRAMQEKEKETKCGQIPPFMTEPKENYIVDICGKAVSIHEKNGEMIVDLCGFNYATKIDAVYNACLKFVKWLQ